MEEEDFVEVFNPWNKEVQWLERMLKSHDSTQKEIIMKEGKDVRAVVRNHQLHGGSNQQQFEELVDSSNNLKQRERRKSKWQSMDQPKDVMEKEIEELW